MWTLPPFSPSAQEGRSATHPCRGGWTAIHSQIWWGRMCTCPTYLLIASQHAFISCHQYPVIHPNPTSPPLMLDPSHTSAHYFFIYQCLSHLLRLESRDGILSSLHICWCRSQTLCCPAKLPRLCCPTFESLQYRTGFRYA